MAEPPSFEERTWEANFATCCLLLEQSCLSVATKSFQTGLIPVELFEAVTNRTLVVTRKQQMLALITALYGQMQAKPTEASSMMKSFLEILEKEVSLDHLRQHLGLNLIEVYLCTCTSTFCFLHTFNVLYF